MQALYFDVRYHNLTSANMWWSQHKHHFDLGEGLLADLSTAARAARTLVTPLNVFRRHPSSATPQAQPSFNGALRTSWRSSTRAASANAPTASPRTGLAGSASGSAQGSVHGFDAGPGGPLSARRGSSAADTVWGAVAAAQRLVGLTPRSDPGRAGSDAGSASEDALPVVELTGKRPSLRG